MLMIKIFLIYHKPCEIFKTEILEPIQSGCKSSPFNLGILKDNTENNISLKNKNYGEMTCWYWVWKNYLPKNPNLEYIGFGHYRRVLAFPNLKQKRDVKKISVSKFKKLLKNYNTNSIYQEIKDFDIIIFEKTKGKCSIEDYYKRFHPDKEWDLMKKLFIKKYPQYKDLMINFFLQNDGYFRCNFIMKRYLFEDFMSWVFDLLNELEQHSDWSKYTDYNSIRTPAFLIERFMNIWIEIKKQEQNIKIKEQKMYIIHPDLPLYLKLLRPLRFLMPAKMRNKLNKKIESI